MLALPIAIGLSVSGCITQTHVHGYVVSQEALEQLPVGSSREQVLLVLGTPTTTATIGAEAFYYISQTTETTAFLKPKIIDQKVLAVYFDKEGLVTQVGHYGLKDGKVFDFISRKTRSGGADLSFIRQLLRGVGRISA